MTTEEIIEEALIDSWKDVRTNQTYTNMPNYKIENNILHIYTPIKPYKIVVLRRLLKVANRCFKNIIVGHPDL